MAQLKDLIVNGASRFIGNIFGTNATLSGNVMPETDNTQSLGDSTHRWKLYGTITGSLDKTFKIKLNNTQYTYDGSANVDVGTIYAPTAGGTANTQALVGNGAAATPKWVNISPSISITAGTSSATPKVNVTVLGQSGTAQAITTATTGVYGATKLTDAYTSTDATLAATGKSILAAIQTLDVSDVGVAAATGNRFISQISETDGKISATLATATIGSATQPIWIDGGTLKATTYSLSATINAGTSGRMTRYSGNNAISDSPNIQYRSYNTTVTGNRTTAGAVRGLLITGTCYGNDAAYLASTDVGVFALGDPGPQLQFGTAEGTPKAALIYTNHNGVKTTPTEILTGSSFHFVSDEDPVNVVAGGFVGKSYLTVGKNHINSSYNLYVNGTSYFNGNTTHNGIDYFANGTSYYINNNADARLRYVGIGGIGPPTGAYVLQVNGTSQIQGLLYSRGSAPESTNQYNLGATDKRWARLYIGTADSYGSATEPIYWKNGVPDTCDISNIGYGIGDIKWTAKTLSLADGWEACSGQILDSTTYPTLYSVLKNNINNMTRTKHKFTWATHFLKKDLANGYVHLYQLKDNLFILAPTRIWSAYFEPNKWYYASSLEGPWTQKTFRNTVSDSTEGMYSISLHEVNGYYVFLYSKRTTSGSSSYAVYMDYILTSSNINNTWNTSTIVTGSSSMLYSNTSIVYWSSQQKYVIAPISGKVGSNGIYGIYVSSNNNINSTYTNKWYYLSSSVNFSHIFINNNNLISICNNTSTIYQNTLSSIPSSATQLSLNSQTAPPLVGSYPFFANSTMYFYYYDDDNNRLTVWKYDSNNFTRLITNITHSTLVTTYSSYAIVLGLNTTNYTVSGSIAPIRYNQQLYYYNPIANEIFTLNDSGISTIVNSNTFGQSIKYDHYHDITLFAGSPCAIPFRMAYTTSNIKAMFPAYWDSTMSEATPAYTNLPTHLPNINEFSFTEYHSGVYETRTMFDTVNAYIKIS